VELLVGLTGGLNAFGVKSNGISTRLVAVAFFRQSGLL